jgi:hypothetical protein
VGPFAASIVNDYQSWDDRESVAYTSVKNSGNVEYSLTDCLRRPLNFKELAASGGVYTSQDRVWLVPAAILPSGLNGVADLKPADFLTDGDSVQWTVLECAWNTLQTWWRLVTRNIVLAYDLRSTLSIINPINNQDASGNRIPNYNVEPAYSNVPCRIQEQEGNVAELLGKQEIKRTFIAYIGQRVTVTRESRVISGGVNYQVTGYRNPDRIDMLMELNLEIIP